MFNLISYIDKENKCNLEKFISLGEIRRKLLTKVFDKEYTLIEMFIWKDIKVDNYWILWNIYFYVFDNWEILKTKDWKVIYKTDFGKMRPVIIDVNWDKYVRAYIYKDNCEQLQKRIKDKKKIDLIDVFINSNMEILKFDWKYIKGISSIINERIDNRFKFIKLDDDSEFYADINTREKLKTKQWNLINYLNPIKIGEDENSIILYNAVVNNKWTVLDKNLNEISKKVSWQKIIKIEYTREFLWKLYYWIRLENERQVIVNKDFNILKVNNYIVKWLSKVPFMWKMVNIADVIDNNNKIRWFFIDENINLKPYIIDWNKFIEYWWRLLVWKKKFCKIWKKSWTIDDYLIDTHWYLFYIENIDKLWITDVEEPTELFITYKKDIERDISIWLDIWKDEWEDIYNYSFSLYQDDDKLPHIDFIMDIDDKKKKEIEKEIKKTFKNLKKDVINEIKDIREKEDSFSI